MLRTAALASTALRRLAMASAGPSILTRALSNGQVLSRRPGPSVYPSFSSVLDHSRGYARGHRAPAPSEDDEDDEDDEECMEEEDIGSQGEWSEFPDEDVEDIDSEDSD